MKNMVKRGWKAIGCLMLIMALVLTGNFSLIPGKGGNSNVMVAKAATVTGRVPLRCYMKSGAGRTYTYTSSSLRTRTGYIEPRDYCKILNLYSNGAVRISYPTSRGISYSLCISQQFFWKHKFQYSNPNIRGKIDGI